jgi:hypothetical protein
MTVQRGWYLALLVTVSGCDYVPWDRYTDRDDPVSSARGFLAAARRDDCGTAWTYFSPETQEKIREQSKRTLRHSPYYADVFSPERFHCVPYVDYRPSTVHLASSDGRRATVHVKERVPDPNSFALPGFTPIGRMDVKRTIELARAPDGWKIVPHVPEDPRAKYGEKTYDIGRAVVVTRPGKLVDGVLKYGVEATMEVEVSPADLEHALKDPEQWPRFWPQVRSARWLAEPDRQGYRPLSVVFALPGGDREARIHLHQAGRTAEHRSFSFGFASEYLYWGDSGKRDKAKGSGRLRWAGTFGAVPDNGPGGGSRVHWSQSIDEAQLAAPEVVAGQLEAFRTEALRLRADGSKPRGSPQSRN